MKTVILCGGKSERLRNYDTDLPKPLWRVGEKPLIWHVLSIYAKAGFCDFILCTGYKHEEFESYFKYNPENDWNITYDFAGEDCGTADRLKNALGHISDEIFFCNYADGLSDVNLSKLLSAHKESGKTATLTAVKPHLPYGVLETDSSNNVIAFHEKPVSDHWLNGGYFVLQRDIEKHLKTGEMLENGTFEKLLQLSQLNAYQHKGNWQCMDTYKDFVLLNQIWEKKQAFWMKQGEITTENKNP